MSTKPENLPAAAAAAAADAARENWLEERVEIKLFKDNGRYRDDVFVSVNGDHIRIRRGVPVMIRRKHALLLDQSELQAMKAADFSQSKQEEYRNAVQNDVL